MVSRTLMKRTKRAGTAFPFSWRVKGLALVVLLASAQVAILLAQCPQPGTNSGKTSTFATYNPLSPAAKAPAAPASQPAFTLPFMPTVPPDQYAAQHAAIAPYARSSFSSPPSVQIVPAPVIPRAPAASTPVAQTPTFSWQGVQQISNLAQPSPDIAVGPSDVLMVANGLPGTSALGVIAQFTRAGTPVKQVAFQDWFAPLIPTICPEDLGHCQIFDPLVRYDQLHGRFLFLAASRTLPDLRTSFLLLSVSNGATFDSGWKIWALNPATDPTGATWADFWRLSYDNAAVYLAGNMFSPTQFQYAKIRVLKKSELYNPSTTTLSFTDAYNMQNADGSIASSIDPVQQRGVPAGVNTALFVNTTDKLPATYLTVWKINDPLAATLSLTCSTIAGLISYTVPAYARQLGGSATIDAGDARMLKAVYRGGFIYTAGDTGYPDAATTVTYDLINTSTMTLSSQARLLNTNSFYPAFDVPATTAPGAQFTNLITGATTAADGSLTYAGISRLKAGEDYFYLGGPLDKQAYGDYFGGAVDPLNGGLWTSGEYAKPSVGGFGQWGTWAGYFPWVTTQAFSDVDATSSFADYINVLGLWEITSGCSVTPARFCPGDVVTRNQMAALLIRSMFGSTFTYTTAPYFTDVPATDPFFSFVQKLRDLGVTEGCSATAYCPEDPVTRSAAATLIVRSKLGSLFGDNFTFPATPYFTDVPAGDSSFPFVQKLSELGITAGCTVTSYCPDRLLTRQEAAVFLTRAFLN